MVARSAHHGSAGGRRLGGTASPGVHAILASALFRCWHILAFFAAWSTAVSVISATTYNLGIASTLLTVLGTVLGFVISYRTTSSFERYNEGRRYWSQIVLASRTFVRLIWIHVPEIMQMDKQGISDEETKAHVLVEKLTVVNLVEAFAVAVKHYLRGEEGIYYVDLYHLVKFLPAYALPAGLPSVTDFHAKSVATQESATRVAAPSMVRATSSRSVGRSSASEPHPTHADNIGAHNPQTSSTMASAGAPTPGPHLPLPASSAVPSEKLQFISPPSLAGEERTLLREGSQESTQARTATTPIDNVEDILLPARNPPRFSYFNVFPFSLHRHLSSRRLRPANLPSVTYNLPHEISLYLSSYVAALQARKAIDPPTTTTLINTVSQLVDALTGLERILTTPIPLSYSIHLWAVTLVYCFVLPFQLWQTLKWLTIPGTIIASMIFFGFLVAGEEIENPFGYDENDLNLDYFTHNVIREELRIITSRPPPNTNDWVFSAQNDCLFSSHKDSERVSPEDWVSRGRGPILAELSVG
ncbi:Bestrophin, RFP-TM, chloride channel-domain-containing protein [Amylostereum chailletii]|nr:Bestrophin, RFP-TM, chloride channel-domain-containing protein [Amylostereum chailletii]